MKKLRLLKVCNIFVSSLVIILSLIFLAIDGRMVLASDYKAYAENTRGLLELIFKIVGLLFIFASSILAIIALFNKKDTIKKLSFIFVSFNAIISFFTIFYLDLYLAVPYFILNILLALSFILFYLMSNNKVEETNN